MPAVDQIEVATTNEPDRWIEILKEVGVYDFYHLPTYQHLAEARVGGRAVLPVFRYGRYTMAFPLLFRDITIPGSTSKGYRDAACVPGLTGPVISSNNPPDDARHGLMQQFQNFLKQNRTVTVYSRLHFLLNQEAFLSGYGQIHEEDLEVTVDLTVPPEVQYSRYRENHRRDLKKLRNLGFVCEEAGREHLNDFLHIYYDTMYRVNARQLYYYEKSYFEYLLSEMNEATHLFVCRDGETIACAGFFAACKGHVHYLWGGTAEEYCKYSPSKLMLDQVRVWGNSIGSHVFHLGGGNESLCNFKMGFGGREHVCSTWRYIADREVYDDLCRQAFALAGRMPEDTYFPEYRSPSLGLS